MPPLDQFSAYAALTRLVLLNGDDVTAPPTRHVLRERLGRLLLPTYGARANAADSLLDLQQTRLARAQAADALAGSGPCAPDRHQARARPTR